MRVRRDTEKKYCVHEPHSCLKLYCIIYFIQKHQQIIDDDVTLFKLYLSKWESITINYVIINVEFTSYLGFGQLAT